LRWRATLHLIDLVSTDSRLEGCSAALALSAVLIELHMRQNRCWRATGKWSLTLAGSSKPALVHLLQAYDSYFAAGQRDFLVDASLKILDQSGGPLWLGHAEITSFGSGNEIVQ
jgi:hypothetical protein